jgi:hypothetical protein
MYKESSSQDLILEGGRKDRVNICHFLGEVHNNLKCASTDSQQEHLNVASCLGCGHACFRVDLLGVQQVLK